MARLDGKIAIVTGAASGIGRESPNCSRARAPTVVTEPASIKRR